VVQWIDWFPAVGTFGNQPITLDAVTVALILSTEFTSSGSFQVQVTTFDDSWNRVPLCTPFNIPGYTIGLGAPVLYQIIFAEWLGGKQIIVDPGQFQTSSGPGRTNSGTEQFGTSPVNSSSGYPVCSIPNIPRGFSVGLLPQGPNAYTAQSFLCGANSGGATGPFDYTQFWQSNGQSRSGGPYPPTIVGGSPLDPNNNPGDGTLATGAIPGYGGTAVPYGGSSTLMGHWGRSKQVLTASRAQNPTYNWEQPYHSLTATVYPATGTQVAAIEMYPSGPNVGTAPTAPVEIQISDSGPGGTSISYVLKGSNSSITGAWTTIGTVLDGDICTAAGVMRTINNVPTLVLSGDALYAYYQLTATLTSASPYFATPTLYSWMMVAQTTYTTFGYMQEFDATETLDPVDGTAEIGELKLDMLRAGPKDYRDLATRIVSQNAASEIEAHVYAVDRVSGLRYFLNSYRLENRNPQDGVESMTFTSGLDRLTTAIPQASQSYIYPTPGAACAPISAGGVSVYGGVSFGGFTNSNLAVIVVNGTPFAGINLVGMFFFGITGTSKGQVFQIVAQPDTNTVGEAWYNPLNHSEIRATAAEHVFIVNCVNYYSATNTVGTMAMTHPAVGDTYQIQSQVYTRQDITYAGQTFAEVYTDIINNQAVVPSRFRGAIPTNTQSATTTDRVITNDNTDKTYNKALDYLSQVALHCGGAVAWIRGQIAFIPIYPGAGSSNSGIVWDDRTIVSLTPTVGADQRIPSIEVKYGYDLATQDFAAINIFNDLNAVAVWGRPNIYDVYQLPDETCKWNDSTGIEAAVIGGMLTAAWSTGKRLWNVETVLSYPWLNMGDTVSIITDDYTDFNGSASADGLTITGFPVVGNQTAMGVIVGKNLWGNKFIVALVKGLNSLSSVGSGPGAQGLQALVCPTIAATMTVEQSLIMPVNIASIAFTVPTSAYYDHMELWVATDGGTSMLQALGSSSPMKLSLNNAHTYTVTPFVVTTGDVRSAGTPLILGPFSSEIVGVLSTSVDTNNNVIYLPPAGLADDGAGAKPIIKGTITFLQRHGDTVTFPNAYQNLPSLTLYQGTTHEIRSLWGTDSQIIAQSGNTTAYSATSTETDESGTASITTSGLVVRARLAQPTSVLTARVANAAGGNSVNAPGNGTAVSLGANLPAYNDQYTVLVSAKIVTVEVGFHPGVGSVTAYIDYSVNSGSTWTAGPSTVLTTGTVGSTTTTVAASLLLAVSGLPASTTEIRLRMGSASYTGTGGSASAVGRLVNVTNDSTNTITWSTTTSGTNYASKTPNPTDIMSLTVYAPS
jgi:hypothetical protein